MYSESTATAIDQEVRDIVDAAFEKALNILKEKEGALIQGAKLLLEKETLSEEEVLAVHRGTYGTSV